MENLNGEIFGFIYIAALRDATLMKAYEGSKSDLGKCEGAKETVRQYVEEVLAGKQPDFYVAEKKLEDAFNDEKFTFGNAQKLLNMACKYFFILCYNNSSLRECFKSCHCPMDNIMIDAVKREMRKCNYDDYKSILDNYEKTRNKKSYVSFLSNSWSKIIREDNDQYKLFQDLVKFLSDKEGVCPLEYDYRMWRNDEQKNDAGGNKINE